MQPSCLKTEFACNRHPAGRRTGRGQGWWRGWARRGRAYDYGIERLAAYSGGSWNAQKTEYVYDGRGSVAQEVSYNNSWYTFGGKIGKANVGSKSYTPFGEQLGVAISGYGFNGQYYDSATGMLNLRVRQYEPTQMRFNGRDLLRGDMSVPLSLNRYLYCQNDPVNYADFSGQSLKKLWNKAKSVARSAVKAVTTTVKKAASAVSTSAKTVVSKATTVVKTTASKVVNTVKSVATAVTTQAKQVITNTITKAATAVSKAKTAVTKAASNAKSAVVNTAKTVGNAVTTTAQSVGNWVVENKDTIAKVGSAVLLVGGVALTVATGGAAGALFLLGTAAGGVVGGIMNEMQGESYFNGWVGGLVSGAIQTGANILTPIIGYGYGGAIGAGTGMLITNILNNSTKDEDKKLTGLEIADKTLGAVVSGGITGGMTAGVASVANQAFNGASAVFENLLVQGADSLNDMLSYPSGEAISKAGILESIFGPLSTQQKFEICTALGGR